MIVVNDMYRRLPCADLLYASDGAWWNAHKGAPGFAGLKVSQDAAAAQNWGVKRVPMEDGAGLSLDPLRIYGGGNGGYQAVNLAVLLGARQILLLGYDLVTSPTGRLHSYPNHAGDLANPDSDCFLRWRKSFETMVPDLERAAIDIVNCSPSSALDCFPKAQLEAVL